MTHDDRGRCFVASYPKSGNTWLRFIIFHLAFRRAPKSSRELDAFVNSANDGSPPEDIGHFRKTHALPSALAPLLTPSSKAIYVVRHPLDVMRSALNYAILTGEAPALDGDALENWKTNWLDAYARFGGHPAWQGAPHFCGTWAQNAEAWYELSAIPVLRLRYEDMLADPTESVSQIAQFLGIELASSELAECVQATSFSVMRAFEEHEMQMARELGRSLGRFSIPARLHAAEKGVRFFDKGQAGTYRTTLPGDVAAQGWEAMGSTAERVGYRF